MFRTRFGVFDGNSWESLCQLVFKKKYLNDGYQKIPASPGDYGLEGFTKSGKCFQCYCPDKHYDRQELYEKQRDKITQDLNKLKTYRSSLEKLLGETKLSSWILVTPEIDKNELLKHAATKTQDVKGWNLPFIAPNFHILLHDGDDYFTEICEIQNVSKSVLNLDDSPACLTALDKPQEVYEQNILRKTKIRLKEKEKSHNYKQRVQALQESTLKQFLESDRYFRKMEEHAPSVHFALMKFLNEYQKSVTELAITWSGTPEELTVKVKDELESRINREASIGLNETNIMKISRYMVARWLAICELDYEE